MANYAKTKTMMKKKKKTKSLYYTTLCKPTNQQNKTKSLNESCSSLEPTCDGTKERHDAACSKKQEE